MSGRRWLQGLINPWVVISALGVALLLLGFTLGILWFSRPPAKARSPATAVLNIIPAPTETPVPPTATPVGPVTPTLPVPPSPPPGVIAIGAYVQITGTGGDGLRLRSEPGLAASLRVLGAENEVFQVQDGPKQMDGYTWWYLVGPYDATRSGWAAANYLSVVQNP